jgi:hypothetical protein
MNSLKKFLSIAVLSALASTAALADDASEKADRINANTNPAQIERTTETASKVKVSLPVVFTQKVCVQTATREVFGRDPSCGYSTVYTWRCYGSYYPAPGYPCYGPTPACYPYQPVPGRPVPPYTPYPPYPGYPYPGYPYGPNQNCGYYPEQVMNACNHPETYCAQYGTTQSTKQAEVTIKFKKSAALQSGTEVFELSGAQTAVDSDEVNFTLKGINTSRDYDIRTRDLFFGGEAITVKAKKD